MPLTGFAIGMGVPTEIEPRLDEVTLSRPTLLRMARFRRHRAPVDAANELGSDVLPVAEDAAPYGARAGRGPGYDRRVSEAISPLTFDDFCAREARGDRRHEFVGGRVYAKAGGSERHDLAAGLCFEALAPAARAAGCRPFTANRLVRTASGAGYYPDVLIVCGRAAHRLYEDDAVLVIEVLSPSTMDIDRREKGPCLRRPPGLRPAPAGRS